MKRSAPASGGSLVHWRALPLVLLLVPSWVAAHAFVQAYTLPVPFELYAWGSVAALVFSFVAIGLFATSPALGQVKHREVTRHAVGLTVRIARALALTMLLLTIAAGMLGSQSPFLNINMTMFWIVFVLAVPYLTALFGDFYSVLNPWRTLVELIERARGRAFRGARDAQLTHFPALLLYMGFIWAELFGQYKPFGLSVVLGIYTIVNIAGAARYGTARWFDKGEFFSVMLKLIGCLAALGISRGSDGTVRLQWRKPFVGLLQARSDGIGLSLFVLFMLSSTAFDGLHGTLPWVSVFWKNIYPSIQDLVPVAPGQKYVVATRLYYAWQQLSMLLSPFFYLLVLALFMAMAKYLTRSALPLLELVNRFALSLVPIAFVYHLTHYYTMLLAQGAQVVRLASDPLGLGWNLFGTGRTEIAPMMLSMDTIWHTQVGAIVVGHIVSVYIAHIEATRVFGSHRKAVLSQLPLLALMVVFTAAGLWILSLPIASG